MDVAAISFSTATSASTGSSGSTAELRVRIQMLQQQITQLEANDTLDAATKEQRIQSLEAQIQKLEARLNSAPQSQAAAGSESSAAPAATSNTVGTLFSAYA